MTEATGLLDPLALAIVLAGTILATLAREGWQDVATAVASALGLWGKGFEAGATRSALARTVREINERGHLGAKLYDPPDEATTRLLNAYIRSGSIDAMMKLARTQRLERDIRSVAATRVFETAGELAPVFGLVGTLFSITQLMPDMETSSADIVMASVAGAVLSSLYGVLSANLLFAPLARAIERRGDKEEAERSLVLEWFEDEIMDGRKAASSRTPLISGVRGAA